jgi:hypothetical protein
MSINDIAYLSVALLTFLITNQTVLADGPDEGLVVPDRYYIEERCKEPDEMLSRVRNDKELSTKVDKKAVETVTAMMRSYCDLAKKGQISGDSWLKRFEEMSNSLNTLTDKWALNGVHLVPFVSVKPRMPVPDNFKAYTMILFPSGEWSGLQLRNDLRTLEGTFFDFGKSIGDIKAAIWFRQQHSDLPDTERAKYYCDMLKLNYNDGPYVVTTRKRPDTIRRDDEVVLIKLGGITVGRVIRVLNILEQDLRTGAEYQKRALIYEEIKQRLLSIADRHPEIVNELVKNAIKRLIVGT